MQAQPYPYGGPGYYGPSRYYYNGRWVDLRRWEAQREREWRRNQYRRYRDRDNSSDALAAGIIGFALAAAILGSQNDASRAYGYRGYRASTLPPAGRGIGVTTRRRTRSWGTMGIGGIACGRGRARGRKLLASPLHREQLTLSCAFSPGGTAMHAEVSLTKANIPLIFGQDAAELEDPDRLKAFFIINEAYDDLRIAHPISLVIGQRGIGKTALLAMSAQADSDEKIPNVSLKGSEILRLSEADARAAIAVEAFKEFVENAILETLVSSLSEGAAELIPIPPKAQNFLSRIAALAAIVVANENAIIKNNAKRAAPWIYESIKTFTVYIDDTDIEWNGSEASARTISNMIQACYNIASESKAKVRFKISIRSDIFNFLRTHADYLDKIQGGIVRLRWSNDDVFRVIAKRIAIFTNKPYDDSNNLSQRQIFQEFYSKIFEEYYKGQGAWENAQTRKVIMSFVRQRPRDLIAFCTLAAQRAVGTGEKINTDQISNIIPNYCRNRLDDTVKEFKSELPEIEFLLREMRPKANAGKGVPRYLFTHDEMVARIKDIAQRKTLKFAYERMPANPAKIIDFLFRINFLVATRNTENGVDRRYYDFADDARSEIEMGRWGWEVHMAYRWAIKKSEDDFWAQVTGI